MAAKLVVIAGADQGQIVPLKDDAKVTIGRGDQANFKLGDTTVSRIHCLVEMVGKDAIVKDCASKSGTHINGRAITEHKLQPDEVIKIGSTQIRFEREI